MNDDEIMLSITKMLNGNLFGLVYFERDHKTFGNMIVKIKSEEKKYTFISDGGDIYCNDDLIYPHSYHVAGEDDTPVYFLKAIDKVLIRGFKI